MTTAGISSCATCADLLLDKTAIEQTLGRRLGADQHIVTRVVEAKVTRSKSSHTAPLLPELLAAAERGCRICHFLRNALLLGGQLGEGPLNLCGEYSFNSWFAGDGQDTLNLILRINHLVGPNVYQCLAAFLVTADYDDVLLTGLWRTPSPMTLSVDNTAFMRHAIETCEITCPQQPNSSSFLPTRLLDLGIREAAEARLVSTSSFGVGCHVKYAALSYSWGTKDEATAQLKTTTANLQQHQRGIKFESMSQVMRDAVVVCRLLCIRYLWMDAVCIIQDGESGSHGSDWDKESEQMGEVFQHAHVTLCAASSRSCQQSFLQGLQSRQLRRIEFHSSLVNAATGHYSLTRVDSMTFARSLDDWRIFNALAFPLALETSHWWKRGWVLQERHMSKRLLIFGNNMVYYICPYCKRSSNGLIQNAQPPSLFSGVIQQLQSDPYTPALTYYNHFTELAMEYSALNLTYEADRLPAISGFAKRIGAVIGDRYLAGLWQRNLYRDLLWCWRNPDSPGPWKPEAPSWSWIRKAAPFMKAAVSDYHLIHEANLHPAYHNIQGQTELASSNPYGEVRGGEIAITTRAEYFAWNGEYKITHTRGCLELIKAENMQYFADCKLDWTPSNAALDGTASLYKDAPGIFLALVASADARRPYHHNAPPGICELTANSRNMWGLILVPMPNRPECSMRIGIFTSRANKTGEASIFDQSGTQTFLIR
ncbi:heterokaryon incompatibility protein-domain-containing protein [Podospora aff. communis PSN243]|uniref:Heterokaryon incompatibility protein-domain-containing protein n=1 Tax=Podospora aff. communis PSN243 TaxID=3040156 RepID=A0AAV9GFV5_9PEZI|nr:heterokaryon incompatibility protein-domain-containing protein [Podospora aff. communis PSN243]